MLALNIGRGNWGSGYPDIDYNTTLKRGPFAGLPGPLTYGQGMGALSTSNILLYAAAAYAAYWGYKKFVKK